MFSWFVFAYPKEKLLWGFAFPDHLFVNPSEYTN